MVVRADPVPTTDNTGRSCQVAQKAAWVKFQGQELKVADVDLLSVTPDRAQFRIGKEAAAALSPTATRGGIFQMRRNSLPGKQCFSSVNVQKVIWWR